MSAGPAEGKLQTAKEDAKTAKEELKRAERKLEAAHEELKVAERKLEAAERKLEAAERKLEEADPEQPEQKALRKTAYELAVKNVNRAGRAVDIAQDAVQRAGADSGRAAPGAGDAMAGSVGAATTRSGADADARTMMQQQQESFQAMMQQQQESFQAMMQKISAFASQIASLGNNEIDPWEGLSATSTTSPDFRARLLDFYGSTNCLLTSLKGTAAHIWPRSRGFSMPTGLDHPKNGMFLLKAIKSAFDRRQVCFICDPFTRSITFKVLDPDLKRQPVGSIPRGLGWERVLRHRDVTVFTGRDIYSDQYSSYSD